MLKRNEYINFKDSKELFKMHEKDTFRLWIWGFLAGLILLIIFLIVNLTIILINREEIIGELIKIIINARPETTPEAALQTGRANFDIWFLVIPVMQLIAVIVASAVYITSIQKSYKEKDFKYISPYPSAIVGGILLLILILTITGFTSNTGTIQISKYQALGWVSLGLFLVIWAVFGREVSFIRRSFLALYFREEAKKQQELFAKTFNFKDNPDFSALLERLQDQQRFQQGGYDPRAAATRSPYGVPEDQAEVQRTEVQEKGELPIDKSSPFEERKRAAIAKLIDLPEAQLFKIAKSLSIFGYEEMSKKDLAEKIYYITTPSERNEFSKG